ncbi:MAG TPA: fused MFS/spermidine synthase [Candidatus Methylomirabilis sp.]|nr:fused MFS/spermidine synthase [Candidatus Methylomirabilis sp.]
MSRGAVGPERLLAISIGFCFFLSGASGLVYEIVWMRMLGLVFGHAVFAVTTVLAAFMGGLALGAALLGRLIDRWGRPLRVYAVLEGAIGLYALVAPALFAAAQTAYVWLYRTLGLSLPGLTLIQFILVSLILLVPTTLMGASLPVLGRFFIRHLDGLGRKVGDLYALNTAGAVLGSAAAGFFLLPALGVTVTTILAAAANLGIGAWALMADRWGGALSEASALRPRAEESVPPGLPADGPPTLPMRLVLIGVGISGAASMMYEVAWTRALRLVVGSSIYAFSAMLTTFLVGLALGSFLFGRIWGRRRVEPILFAWFEIAAGLTALLLIPTFARLPELVLSLFSVLSPSAGGAVLIQFALSFLVMIVPVTVIGGTFPCAVQICSRALPRLGRDIGTVYSVNTTGTIAGAVLAGFFLIPWLGAQGAMTLAAALNTAVGLAVLAAVPCVRPIRRLAGIPIALLFLVGMLLFPGWDRQVMLGGVSIYATKFTSAPDPAARFREEISSRQLVFHREGLNSTVAVERTDRATSLKVDGKVDASNGVDMATQLMSGHLPVLLHPRPERVLVIGLGSGVTVGALAQHAAIREITVVELEPAVVEASAFFTKENRSALADPRVRVVIADGRNFILADTQRYDVITSEPSNPWMAGVANLFSLEFYRLARQRLADGGLMVQWLHGYSLFPRELRMIVNTFGQVFPHSTLWATIPGDYLMVGAASPLPVDYALLERRIAASPTVREDLASLRLDSPLDLLTFFLLDETALARLADGVPANTDDKPLLEFAAPLALYADTIGENTRLLRSARGAELPRITNLPAGLLEQRRVHFARVYWARGEKAEALDQLRKAPPLDSEDVASQVERAKLLFSLGEIAQATAELARLSRLRPSDQLLASYRKVGTILQQMRAEEAVAQHGRTRLGDPNLAEAHNNLGIFYTRLGIRFGEPAFFELAVDALKDALSLEPQSYAALNNLANAYFELGRLPEAAQVYQQVIDLAPGLAEARFNLGLVYEKQGKSDPAAREFQAAIALNPAWELPRVSLNRLRAPSASRQ